MKIVIYFLFCRYWRMKIISCFGGFVVGLLSGAYIAQNYNIPDVKFWVNHGVHTVWFAFSFVNDYYMGLFDSSHAQKRYFDVAFLSNLLFLSFWNYFCLFSSFYSWTSLKTSTRNPCQKMRRRRMKEITIIQRRSDFVF